VPRPTATERAQRLWSSYLTGETAGLQPTTRLVRRLFSKLPAPPRCKVCLAPFHGIGGLAVAAFGFGAGKSRFNPFLCDRCEKIVKAHQVGAEVEMTLLFADIRGSTGLAEAIGPTEFHRLIDRFYRAATDVLVRTDALIDKLVGDEVVALYAPGIAGPDFARKAVAAGRDLLVATGHADPAGPWISIGVGVHSGAVYVGAVGSSDGQSDITVLGDPANTAARLASQAAAGELLVSRETLRLAEVSAENRDVRALYLKGRSQPVEVGVFNAGTPAPPI
jgi:adenylate cyclase